MIHDRSQPRDANQTGSSLRSADLGSSADLLREEQQVIEVVKSVGHRLLDLRSHGLTVDRKADGSKVTNADLLASQILVDELRKIRDVPVVSEENFSEVVNQDLSIERGWWLIDPIDGTSSYIGDYPEFGICVALIEQERPVMGIVGGPALGAIYYATEGNGAHRLDIASGLSETIHSDPPESDRTLFAGYYGNRLGVVRWVRDKLALPEEQVLSVTPVAAVFKFIDVARGRYHAGGGPNLMSTWDIAAADRIVHEAGGALLNAETGTPFRYRPNDCFAGEVLALAKGVGVTHLSEQPT